MKKIKILLMSAMLAFAMVAVLGLGLKVSATTIEETGKAQDVVATSSVDSSRKSTIVAQFNSDFTKTDLRLLGTLEGIQDLAKLTDIQFILTLNKTDGTTKEAKVAVNTLYKAVTGLEGYAAAENTYYAVYVVNGIQEVVSQLNGSTIKVSLEYTYDGKPNTVSMENAIDLKVVRANYTEDFSLETADGTWKYGAVNYHWGETETFDFMLATEKISGNDGWKASGVEIKGDWISSDSMAGIAYTVTEDVHIAINLNFFGGTEGTRLTLRIGVKSSDGILYSNPSFHSNPNSNTLEIMGKVVDLKAGDTIYFIFDNEAKGVEGAYPNGRLSIDLIKSKTA